MSSIFCGKTIAATGKLKNYTRKELYQKLVAVGAKAVGSVSNNTDFLIVGERAGKKLEKARELGVTVLSEVQFEILLQ